MIFKEKRIHFSSLDRKYQWFDLYQLTEYVFQCDSFSRNKKLCVCWNFEAIIYLQSIPNSEMFHAFFPNRINLRDFRTMSSSVKSKCCAGKQRTLRERKEKNLRKFHHFALFAWTVLIKSQRD